MVRVLSETEESLLLSHCSPYLQDLVVFAVNTGFRLSDILNLTWEVVDLDAATRLLPSSGAGTASQMRLRLLQPRDRRPVERPLARIEKGMPQ